MMKLKLTCCDAHNTIVLELGNEGEVRREEYISHYMFMRKQVLITDYSLG